MSDIRLTAKTRQRIAALTAKGEAAAWTPETLLGDDEQIRVPRFGSKCLYSAIISQFLHGERAAVRLCQRLGEAIDDPIVKGFLKTQIADETRHARAYELYLERLDGVRPIDPHFERALDRTLAWDGPPQALLLGFHILLEGEALRTLTDFQTYWPCPVFAGISALIGRDEARHVAFGKLFLRDTLPALSAAAHRTIFADVQALWRETSEGLLSDSRIPDFFTRPLRRRWLDDGWRHHCRAFAEVGLISAATDRHDENRRCRSR